MTTASIDMYLNTRSEHGDGGTVWERFKRYDFVRGCMSMGLGFEISKFQSLSLPLPSTWGL